VRLLSTIITRRTWRLIRLLLIAYSIVLVLMMFMENSLLYFPTKFPDGDWQPPGLRFEDAWFQAAYTAGLSRTIIREQWYFSLMATAET
jgi:hypothetical protein